MEQRKWMFTFMLALTISILALTFRIMESNRAQHFNMGELTGVIFSKLASWTFKHHDLKIEEEPIKSKSIGPNLTTCHQSYGRPDLVVNCCPPGFETPQPFINFKLPSPNSPKRIRRPIHFLDESYIAKYNKALSIMKSLPENDPRSFSRQANLHCLACTGSYRQQNSHDPVNVHRSWLFFPWHRMMLYFHERILGSLIEDETFGLPVWTWDIPVGMKIPDIYININSSFFHSERDLSHFSPKTVDLSYNREINRSLEEQVDINLAFMYNQMISGARKTELFMGCSYKAHDKFCDRPGTIESAPHNTLHSWLGSGLNPGREDMGKFYSAARDPIFYSHHANVDRLWEVWREIHGNRLDIEDPDWLDSFFFFHDENLKLVKIKVRDVVDITKLGYSYEEVDRPWLNKRPKPSIQPNLALQALKLKENTTKFHLSDFDPSGRTLKSSLTVKASRFSNQLKKLKKKNKEEEAIVVYGIQVKEDAYVKFDVYVNMVDDQTMMSPKLREFAGTFAHIPGGREMEGRKINLKLGVSEMLEDLEAEKDESIWVTLLPITESCRNVTIEDIRIEYIN